MSIGWDQEQPCHILELAYLGLLPEALGIHIGAGDFVSQ